MTFTFYSTPGHGYLRVPKKTFLELGGNPETISRYSGHDQTTLYLEEDCDACNFLDLVRENGIEPNIKSTYKDSVSITHNYDPKLFGFEFKEGVKVRLCSSEIATLEYIRGTKPGARTETGYLYRIPKSNPFKYITEVLEN